jgi:hypothetical protein
VLPPNNYEIFLGDLNSDKQVRLTYNDAFDGYPSISPDGHRLLFTSTRDTAPGAHATGVYLQDIPSLHIGPSKTTRKMQPGQCVEHSGAWICYGSGVSLLLHLIVGFAGFPVAFMPGRRRCAAKD